MTPLDKITPTMSVPLWGGEVTVHAFGRNHGHNFSFMGIDSSENVHVTHPQIFAALGSIPAECDFYAPSPTLANAEITTPQTLKSQHLAKVWAGRRSVPPAGDFFLRRGIPADGLAHLDVHTGYTLSSADCALVVVKSDELIVAAHAGRNSIIDMNYMKTPDMLWEYRRRSVIETICHDLIRRERMSRVQVWVGFSISPGPHFPHAKGNPQHPQNTRLVDEIIKHYGESCFKDDGQNRVLGWLDTKELIRQQFIHLGVPEGNIALDSVCTHSDMKDGEHLWHSNVRSGKERNLVAVVVNP